MHHFKYFSEVPNRFKYRQNAPFIVLVFRMFSAFQIVSMAVRMHHLASLFSKLSLQFQIVSMPSECTLQRPCFQNYLCNSKLSQIPSESTLYCPCFQNFQEATLVLMLPSCFGTNYVLFFLLKFQISFKSVKRQALATLF